MNWLALWQWMLDLGWLFFLLMLLRRFWLHKKILLGAQSWLKAKGRITECEWTEAGHSVWPKIEYSYQVYDKDLIGHYLFLDTSHNNPNSNYSRRMAYNAAIAFKEHREIDVYYNPNQPEQSALDVAIPLKLNIILGVLGFLVGLQVLLIIFHVFFA
jgi:hypothetical protein